jgi:hypothetical protein
MMKYLLVIVFALDARFKTTVLIIVACCCGIALLYCYIVYLPFYRPAVNSAHIAGTAVFCWACFCLILLQIRGHPQVRTLFCRRFARSL